MNSINLLIINIVSFLFIGLDKLQATRNKSRLSEISLLTISIFGGSAGTLIGMIIFRHKIRKPKFLILIPLFLIIHILIYKGYLN